MEMVMVMVMAVVMVMDGGSGDSVKILRGAVICLTQEICTQLKF